jgi:lysophospholipase L1-like esterase
VFPFGDSKVTCTATDAVLASTSCTFTVTLTQLTPPPAVLSVTRFVAFGDSITEGKLSDGTLLGSNGSYPSNLAQLLKARYPSQASTITVQNEGCSGETAAAGSVCGGGVVRLPGVLALDNPQAVLLLEGANDLFGGDPAAIPKLIDALRTMVRQVKARGIPCFLSTLTPVRQGGIPPRGNGGFALTPTANDQIRQLAASEGVILVDLFAGFGNSPDPFIGGDGLHPTLDGYQRMADIYFASIQQNVESAPLFVHGGEQPFALPVAAPMPQPARYRRGL